MTTAGAYLVDRGNLVRELDPALRLRYWDYPASAVIGTNWGRLPT